MGIGLMSNAYGEEATNPQKAEEGLVVIPQIGSVISIGILEAMTRNQMRLCHHNTKTREASVSDH